MMLSQCIKTVYKPFSSQRRSLFYWLNIIFNRVDVDRRKEVGPDRSCAEWLLRNGAYIKWNNSPSFLTDYNKLPVKDFSLSILEVDASEASIMHYGFEHFVGCNSIRKINFHKCYYLENRALQGLAPLKNSLEVLRISECLNISEVGLMYLTVLTNLKELILVDLPYVKDKNKAVSQLQNALPKCKIQFH